MLYEDVDRLIGKGRQVSGPHVVLQAGRRSRIEHRLMLQVGLGSDEIHQWWLEAAKRPEDALALLERPRPTGDDRCHRQPMHLPGKEWGRGCRAEDEDGGHRLGQISYPLSIEAEH